jgi:peptidoglycan/xylan/chitin deacetylase (PgdA/CDA1 family)
MSRFMLLVSLAGKAAAVGLWASTGSALLPAACFFGPDAWFLYHLFVPSAQGLCRVLTRFETGGPEVWLTIDDGPDPDDTPRILDLLDGHKARATFFLIGERAERFPGLVGEILRRGHEVGHHTQTHPAGSFWCASPRRLGAELADALAAFGRAGARPRWFRCPAGIKNLFLGPALASRGLQCVGWNARSFDTCSRDPAGVRDRIMRRVKPGSIVLMHEGPGLDPRVRVKALSLVLDALSAKRLTCVLPMAAPLGSLE